MKSSCIAHPPNEPLIIVRAWQIRACDGDGCAAMLLSYFEYWHNIKIDQARKSRQQNEIAERHGESGAQDTSLLQFHNEKDLTEGILHLYGKNTIAKSLEILHEKGFVTREANPTPRYKFDRTRYFLFHPAVVSKWLSNNGDTSSENGARQTENGSRPSDLGAPSPEDGRYIRKETTLEIPTETTKERKPALAVVPAKKQPKPADPTIQAIEALEGVITEVYQLQGLPPNQQKNFMQDSATLHRYGATPESLREFLDSRRSLPTLGFISSDYHRWKLNEARKSQAPPPSEELIWTGHCYQTKNDIATNGRRGRGGVVF